MIYTLDDRHVELRGEEHYLAPNATLIGSIVLEDRTSIWFNATLRGDNEPIVVGEGTNIQDGSVLHTDEGFPLVIGKNVTVGHMVVLHGCTVGNNCLIGINAVVLNNVEIGDNCLIGANTLIPEGKKIPGNSLVMGSPGKIVRELSPEQIVRIRQSAEHYVENLRRYTHKLRLDARFQ